MPLLQGALLCRKEQLLLRIWMEELATRLVFWANLMIRGAEWADRGLSKARVIRNRIAQKPGPVDGFAIWACSGRDC